MRGSFAHLRKIPDEIQSLDFGYARGMSVQLANLSKAFAQCTCTTAISAIPQNPITR
jgi:hypothetical protein